MRKGKSLILTVLLFCLVICTILGLVACNKETKLNIIESDDGYTWEYNQPFVDEMDDDMKIDGKLDENRWNESGKKWLTHVEKDVKMRYTTSFSEKGLYIAAEAKDVHMQWNDTRAFMNNSSFFFYIISNKATEYHAFDCMGFYVDELHSACRQGSRFAAKGLRTVDEDGIPTLTAEFFASWKSLNYTVDSDTGMPESAKFVPAYRYVEAVESNENAFLKPALAELGGNRVDNAYAFDTNGYINVDVEGAELGNGANGFAKSDGWDLSAVTDGENKKVTSTTEGDQAIFFKNINSTRYSYSVTITYKESIAAGFPAVGVLDMKNAADFNIMRFHGEDITGPGKNYRYFLLDFHNGRSDVQKGSYAVASSDIKTLRVRVIKDNTRYYYIIDDSYAFAADLNWLGGKTVPGLYTFDAKAEFSDWEATDYEGAANDKAFEELCEKYIKPVKIASDISGGTVTADKLAVAENGEGVQLSVLPARGYVLTELTVNGKSIYDKFVIEMNNGVATIVPTEATVINAVFSPMPAADTLRIVGAVKRSSGAANIGLPYTVSEQSGKNKILYNSGSTTSAGMFDVTVLKKGKHIVGGKTIETDGIYTLTFEGQFPHGETNTFMIDTSDDKFTGNYYSWDDIVLNPLKVNNMTKEDDDTIRTTHTSYTGENFCYYVTNDTVSGAFQLDMTVTATNDKWPCYGFTIEDENNNSLQLFAAGSTTYRIMSSYDGVNYEQFDKSATYIDGISRLKLIYDEKKDVFLFYVNNVLFDTLRRADYLTGKTFRFGPVGYMSGADGSVESVTDENPFATFTVPTVTKEFTVSVPQGATIVTSDGVTITAGKVPVLSSVTVTVPKTAEKFYTIYVNGVPVTTDNTDTAAKATFDVSSDCNVTYKQSYAVSGTVTGGDENCVIVIVTETGTKVFEGKGTSFTTNLSNGGYYVSAKTDSEMSKGEWFEVNNTAVETITLTIDQPKINHYAFINQWGGWTWNMVGTYEDGKSVYHIPNHDYWAGVFDGGTFSKSEDYIVKAKLNIVSDNPNNGTVAGLALYSTTADDANNVKFEIVYDGGAYFLRVRGNNNGGFNKTFNSENTPWVKENQDVLRHNAYMAVVHKNGGYYVFINNTLVLSLTGSDATVIDNEIKTDNLQVGVYAEFEVTYAEWGYSTDGDEISALVGRKITAADMTVTVNGEFVTDGNVMLGDRVTVSMMVTDGETVSFLVDGKVVETNITNGKATANFIVTGNHTVTVSVNYTVSGVTEPDATVVFVNSDGTEVQRVTADEQGNFSVMLPDGTYYASAETEKNVSAVSEITVDGVAVPDCDIKVNRAKVTELLFDGDKNLIFDRTTGHYYNDASEPIWAGGFFADATVAQGKGFELSVTMKDMAAAPWPSAGLLIGTSKTAYVRFNLIRNSDSGVFGLQVRSSAAGETLLWLNDTPFENPFGGEGGTLTIKLLYHGGWYSVYFNGTLIGRYDENMSLGDKGTLKAQLGEGNLEVGMYAERAVTFIAWDFKTENIEIPAEARLNGSFEGVTAFTYSAKDCAYKSVWNNNNQRSVSDINVKAVTEWVWSADVHVLSDWAYPSVGLALYDKDGAKDFIVKIIRLTPNETSDNKDAQTCQLKIGTTDFGADPNGNATQQWVDRNKTEMKDETKMALVHNANGYYLFINNELVWSATGEDAEIITSDWEEVNLGIFAEQEASVKNLTYSTDISSYNVN